MVKKSMLALAAMLLVLIIATAVWAWAPDRPRSELEGRYWDAATRYLTISGTSLRVRITGAVEAPAIILIHGFGSSLETWEPWAQTLSKSYRVVRFDLPGSGLSEPDRSASYLDTRSLQLVKALMEQLRIEQAVLVGNSMGGRIAWRFAAEFPGRVRKLVLISPDGFASPGFEYGKAPRVPAVAQLMRFFLPRRLVRTNLEAAYGDATRLNGDVVNRYYDLLLAPGNRQAMIERLKQSVPEDPVPVLQRIASPTLLLWGKKDRLIPFSNSADYQAALPHSNLIALSELGHVPQEEDPTASLTAIATFISAER